MEQNVQTRMEKPPVGRLESVEGEVFILHQGRQVPAQPGFVLFAGDVIETSETGRAGMVFADRSTFTIGQKGRLVVDDFLFDASAGNGTAVLSVDSGVFGFVSGEIAKFGPDAMIIRTPVAMLGIRGTTGAGRFVPGEGLSLALMPDPETGLVGEIVLSHLNGQTVTLSAVGMGVVGLGTDAVSVTVLTGFESASFVVPTLPALPPPPSVPPSLPATPPPAQVDAVRVAPPAEGAGPRPENRDGPQEGASPEGSPEDGGLHGPGGEGFLPQEGPLLAERGRGEPLLQENRDTLRSLREAFSEMPLERSLALREGEPDALPRMPLRASVLHEIQTQIRSDSPPPPDDTSSSSSSSSTVHGHVVDGYVRDATVFRDLNNNGVRDEGEPFSITDASGAYAMPEGSGGRLMVPADGRAIDVVTGMPLRLPLAATAGATVISPLTTLAVKLGGQSRVLGAFGLPSSLDLTTFDPIGALGTNPTLASKALTAGVQVVATVAALKTAIALATGDTSVTMEDVFGSLVTRLGQTSSTLDLGATTDIRAILDDVAPKKNLSISYDVGTYIAEHVAALNSTIANTITTHGFNSSDARDAIITAVQEGGTTGILNLIKGTDNGNDTLNGTDGHDALFGGGGNDFLHGLAGNDILVGGAGDDTLDGGAGTDLARFSASPDEYLFSSFFSTGGSSVSVQDIHAPNGEGSNTLTTIERVEFKNAADSSVFDLFVGGTGDDTLDHANASDSVFILGGFGNDTLTGGSSHDILFGEGGDDALDGGSGNDILVGGSGNDILTGNSGADTFVLDLNSRDTITDFTVGANDHLIIRNEANPQQGAAIGLLSTSYAESNQAVGGTVVNYQGGTPDGSGISGVIVVNDGPNDSRVWYSQDITAADTNNSYEVAFLMNVDTSALDHTNFSIAPLAL